MTPTITIKGRDLREGDLAMGGTVDMLLPRTNSFIVVFKGNVETRVDYDAELTVERPEVVE